MHLGLHHTSKAQLVDNKSTFLPNLCSRSHLLKSPKQYPIVTKLKCWKYVHERPIFGTRTRFLMPTGEIWKHSPFIGDTHTPQMQTRLLTPVAWGGGRCCCAGCGVDRKRPHFLATGGGGGGHHCNGFFITIALIIVDFSSLLMTDVALVVTYPQPLHFFCMPPPPVILLSCHALPHASILALQLCLHRLVVASPLVAAASIYASASCPLVHNAASWRATASGCARNSTVVRSPNKYRT